MNKASQDRIRCLEKRHASYSDSGLEEHEADRLMADLGHPFSEDYRVLWGEFQRLKYNEDFSTRYIAYRDDDNFATMKQPGLGISANPKLEGYYNQFKGALPCWPGQDWQQYLAYVRRCGKVGWPAICEPTLECEMEVQTFDCGLIAELFKITKGKVMIEHARDYDGRKNRDMPFRMRFAKYIHLDGRTYMKVLAMIRKRMKRWVLPLRTEADTVMDSMPVALEQKPFRLANVQQVTETDHAILVPLIPFTDGANPVLENAVNAILKLVERGYPWRGDVRHWMEKFLKPHALRSLDKKYVTA